MQRSAWVAGVSALVLTASVASADQCQVLTEAQAIQAVNALQQARGVARVCEPCGERIGPGVAVAPIASVARHRWEGDARQWVVRINGRDVDLAYMFFTVNGTRFVNLASVTTCHTTGVTASFDRGQSPVAPPAVLPPTEPGM
ncbi:MAG: hypothetical protein JNK72_25985 [Myxococcales bacterium]|nr:hypothetical protein [Myxococcales bacterium]